MKLSFRQKSIAIGSAIAIVAGGIGLPIAFADRSERAACPNYLLVEIPGTGETSPSHNSTQSTGMLKNLSDRLGAGRSDGDFQVFSTPYPATIVDINNATTYATSKDRAVTNASNEMRTRAARCPNTKFGIDGYSQGADAAGDLAAQIGHGNGPVPASRMFGVALLSDPKQTPGKGVLLAGDPKGEGFAGTRSGGFGALQNLVGVVCDDQDKYCTLGSSNFTMQLVGRLGSQIDPQDPVKSAAGILGEFMSVDFSPITRVTDQIKNSMTGPQGPQGIVSLIPQAPQLATQVAKALEDLGVQFGNKEMFAGLGPLSTTSGRLLTAVTKGDVAAIPGLLTQLVPQLITFSANLYNSVSTIISKLPAADYVQIGGTAAAIQAAAAAQQYWVIPGLIGRIVGQIDMAARNTMRAVPEKDFPLIHRIANELTAEQALKDLTSYALFLAGGKHVSYASVPVSSEVGGSGQTGITLLANFMTKRINGSAA